MPTTKTDEQLLAELTTEKKEIEDERLDNQRRLKAVLDRIVAKHGGQIPDFAHLDRRVGADEEIVRIAPRTKAKIDPKWMNVLKTCPHCGIEKNVGRDFGTIKKPNGTVQAAGWCKQCRSESSGKYNRPSRKK